MSADRWFRALLRVLPFDFRSDYGGEMEQVFREQRRTSRGPVSAISLWTATVAAMLAIGPREHLAQLRQDVAYAGRGIRRNPGFVTVAALTLAIGIGANTAIFSVVYAVMLRPLPYPDPDRLVSVSNRWTGSPAARLSDPEYLDYAEQSRTLDIAVAAGTNVNVSGGAEPERVSGLETSVNTLDVLGMQPALGRSFRPEEERAGSNHVMLISDGFWRRRFAADPTVVGRSVLVDGVPHQVLGVMPPAVPLPPEFGDDTPADVLLPLVLDRAAPRSRRGGHYLQAFARLRPGVSRESASSEMDGIVQRLIAEYPDQHNQGAFGISIVPLRDDLIGATRPVLLTLSAAVGLVLLLACANVANLMLTRGESRRRELVERIERLPGVRRVGASSGLPLAIGSGDWSFDIEGRSRVNGRRPGAADWFVVTPGYFETLGIPLERGRLPSASDTTAATPVIVINATAAHAIFPNQDPIGRRIRLSQTTGGDQPWRTIVGIVADVRQRGLDTSPRPEMFVPHAQFQHFAAGVQARSMSVVVKTETEPAALASPVRSELRALDPEVPAARVADMHQVLSASIADRRLNVMLFGGFGVLALTLAAIGLYGVVAYNVTARTREMGVRLAIGATRATVLSMVLTQALRLVAVGIAVGLVAALLAGGALTRLLFEVGPHDVPVFIGVPAGLLLAGALASYLPARRATRVDPVVALRAE